MKWYMYAVLTVIVLFVVYNIATWNVASQDEYLTGFWAADGDEFCQRSDINSMLLYIGERVGTKRNCYLIIMDDLANTGLTLEYTRGWAGPGIGGYHIKCKTTFDDEQIWPECVDIDVNMLNGTVKIYSADTVYAELTKQHETTNLTKKLSYDSESDDE